jgi:hypothetical protein
MANTPLIILGFTIVVIFIIYLLLSECKSEGFQNDENDIIEMIELEAKDIDQTKKKEPSSKEIENEINKILFSDVMISPRRITNQSTDMIPDTQGVLIRSSFKILAKNDYEEFDSSVQTIVENIETIFNEKSFNLDIDGEILEAKHTIKQSGNDAIINIIIIAMFL